MNDRNPKAEEQANSEIARDLANVGVTAGSPWDLVGSGGDKPWSTEAAQVLANHLTKPHPQFVLQGIILAGCWLETRNLFFDTVVRILRENGCSILGQVAANGLLRMAKKDDAEIMRSLIMDKSVGESRGLLIEGYGRFAKQGAIPTLRANIHDPDVRSEVLKALSKLGDQSIRGELLELCKHPDSFHRKIARDALARLDNKATKSKPKKTN